MDKTITDSHFNQTPVQDTFDEHAYLESIQGRLTSIDYQKNDLTSIMKDENDQQMMPRSVSEHIITLYNDFNLNNDSYAVLNFFDYHFPYMDPLDREILLYKTVVTLGENLEDYQWIIEDEKFELLGVEYISRITNLFLDTYLVSEEMLKNHPDMPDYIEVLKKTINGGYQIRKVDNKYYVLTDYTAAFSEYKPYLSEESATLIDILIRESRNPLFVEGYYQRENETAAYKANEIEVFIDEYPKSVYKDMLEEYYKQYLRSIVSNPRNIERVGFDQDQYRENVIVDFNKIIDRYAGSRLENILSDFLGQIEAGSFEYNPEIIEKVFYEIEIIY